MGPRVQAMFMEVDRALQTLANCRVSNHCKRWSAQLNNSKHNKEGDANGDGNNTAVTAVITAVMGAMNSHRNGDKKPHVVSHLVVVVQLCTDDPENF